MSRFKRTFGGLSTSSVKQTAQTIRAQGIQLLQSCNPSLTKAAATAKYDAAHSPKAVR